MTESRFGFSTGALELANFSKAVEWLSANGIKCVEVSALRLSELDPLVRGFETLELDDFDYVSIHAPSSFRPDEEPLVVSLLQQIAGTERNVVVHPDVMFTPSSWLPFGSRLLIENMDRRKAVGRTVEELEDLFHKLPEARLCLDLAHARQFDTTLGVLRDLVLRFRGRIGQVHISELDSTCQHRPLSYRSITDYRRFADELSEIPIISEAVLLTNDTPSRLEELQLSMIALKPIDRDLALKCVESPSESQLIHQ